jgi:hypothetical protein
VFDHAELAVQGALDAGAAYSGARIVISSAETINVQSQNQSQLDRPDRVGVGVRALIGALGPRNIPGIADDARVADSEFGPLLVHARSMRLASWNFTGGAEG